MPSPERPPQSLTEADQQIVSLQRLLAMAAARVGAKAESQDADLLRAAQEGIQNHLQEVQELWQKNWRTELQGRLTATEWQQLQPFLE